MEINEAIKDWFSLRWFSWSVLKSFEWENEFVLWLLLLIPVIFIIRWLILHYKTQKLDVALPEKELKFDPVSLLRFLPSLFAMLFFCMVLIALARPQSTNEKVEQWTEGIDIMLVMDISESMQIQDFRPNRLEAAKNTATEFIAGRFQDRIGMVIFSGEAYSLSPLTTDYEMLNAYIGDIDFEMIENRGTAIGSALAVGTNRMRESKTQSKVLILLSDGENNAGNIDPITAAELAQAYGIKIYTIAIGKEGKVPFGKDFFGRTRYIENELDETTLKEIAEIGEGQFYRVSDNMALEKVFSEINELEKAEIKETRYKDTTDYYMIYLYWALLFFTIWLASKSTFMASVLED